MSIRINYDIRVKLSTFIDAKSITFLVGYMLASRSLAPNFLLSFIINYMHQIRNI